MSEKICSRCKELKPLAEFHNNHSSPDGKGWYCIPCHEAAMAEGFTGELAESTALALAALAAQGIPAVARVGGWCGNWQPPAYVDILAWGIVAVEAKGCYDLDKYGRAKWTWNNADPFKDDVVMLGDFVNERWYIFRNDDPIFINDGHIGRSFRPHLKGQRKTGLCISRRFAQDFGRALSNWDVIEEIRTSKAALLRAGKLKAPLVKAQSVSKQEQAIQAGQLHLWERVTD